MEKQRECCDDGEGRLQSELFFLQLHWLIQHQSHAPVVTNFNLMIIYIYIFIKIEKKIQNE